MQTMYWICISFSKISMETFNDSLLKLNNYGRGSYSYQHSGTEPFGLSREMDEYRFISRTGLWYQLVNFYWSTCSRRAIRNTDTYWYVWARYSGCTGAHHTTRRVCRRRFETDCSWAPRSLAYVPGRLPDHATTDSFRNRFCPVDRRATLGIQ